MLEILKLILSKTSKKKRLCQKLHEGMNDLEPKN